MTTTTAKRATKFVNTKDECNFHEIDRPVCILLKAIPGENGSLGVGWILFKEGDFYTNREDFEKHKLDGDPLFTVPFVSLPANVVEDFRNGTFFKLIQPA